MDWGPLEGDSGRHIPALTLRGRETAEGEHALRRVMGKALRE